MSELSKPAVELSIPFCAAANKKAGKKLPAKPEMLNQRMSFLLRFFNLLMANGNKNKKVIPTRMEPTSTGSK